MQRIAVIVDFIFAVGDDDGFVVVDESETRADKMPGSPLPLNACGNREAKIHVLKILLGDVGGFRFGQSIFPKFLVDGVYLGLKFIAVVKSQK